MLAKKVQTNRNKVKARFDKQTKEQTFLLGHVVLIWDAQKNDKKKHGNFDNMWLGPFKIAKVMGNNTFVLWNLQGEPN